MSDFIYDGHKINYEIYGRGKPLVILNGIMMSTKSWHEFLEPLTKYHQVILVDFIDQGESSSFNGKRYLHSYQTLMLKQLLDFLNLEKVSIAAISYGGQIALDLASKYPTLVEKLILFNTTSYVNDFMREIFELWLAAGKTKDGLVYYKATIPTIYSQTFFKEKLEWMKEREKLLVPLFEKEVFLNRMERLVNSTINFNIFDNVKNITAKTLLIASDEDFLTPISMQEELNKEIKDSNIIILPKTGHASMYEKPVLFTSIINGFLSS